VIADSGGGGFADGRVGSQDIMSLIAQTCPSVTAGGTTLYDCAGQAAALLAGAGQS
jgi:hypothetical protein